MSARSVRVIVETWKSRDRTSSRYSRRATWLVFGNAGSSRVGAEPNGSLTPRPPRSRVAASGRGRPRPPRRCGVLVGVDRPPDVVDEDLLEGRLGDLEVAAPARPPRSPRRGRSPARRRRRARSPTGRSRAGGSARPARRPARAAGGRRRPTAGPVRRPLARLTSRSGPPTTSRPWSTIAIDSHIASTVSIWWVEKISVRPSVAELEERLAQEGDVDRVEPGERLVHEQDLRVVEDRRDELDLLLVALRQLLGAALGEVRDRGTGASQASASRRRAIARRRP